MCSLSQYACVGVSVYDEAKMREVAAGSRYTDLVQLPLCEGVEIIAAAEMQESPALLASTLGPTG